MNKRLRKKISKKTAMMLLCEKECKSHETDCMGGENEDMAADVTISSYICPICGLHLVNSGENHFTCVFCQKEYGPHEVSFDDSEATEEETSLLIRGYKIYTKRVRNTNF